MWNFPFSLKFGKSLPNFLFHLCITFTPCVTHPNYLSFTPTHDKLTPFPPHKNVLHPHFVRPFPTKALALHSNLKTCKTEKSLIYIQLIKPVFQLYMSTSFPYSLKYGVSLCHHNSTSSEGPSYSFDEAIHKTLAPRQEELPLHWLISPSIANLQKRHDYTKQRIKPIKKPRLHIWLFTITKK